MYLSLSPTYAQEKKVQFYFDAGVLISDHIFDELDHGDLGFMIAVNALFKKHEFGIRYRKSFFYLSGRKLALQAPASTYTNLSYYEVSSVELFKRFNVSNLYDVDKFISLGAGPGWVYPNYPDQNLWIISAFFTYPVGPLELEARVNLPLQEVYADWRVPIDEQFQPSRFNLSLFFRLPRNYYN
ncbi:MAG: hypothetical protein AAFR87_29070 [Bacteroidota bacterium]